MSPGHGSGRRSSRDLVPLLALLLALPAAALDPGKAVTQYVREVWQTEQGLPQTSVRAICQTRDGYLWIGTEEGLVRFDGVRFVVFDKRNTPALSSSNVSALREDLDGNLWIGTGGGGLSRLSAGTFTTFGTEDGLSSLIVRTICVDRAGTLWVGTAAGLNRLPRAEPGGKRPRFTAFTTRDGLANDAIFSTREDRTGALWVGTLGGGLDVVRDGAIRPAQARGLGSDPVSALYEDRAGRLWIGTLGSGLHRFESGTETRVPLGEGSSERVTSIAEDRDGNLWIGTYGGLKRLAAGSSRDPGPPLSLAARDGLSSDAVSAIFEDREGALWLGTYGGGLNRLRDGKVTPFSVPEGLSRDAVRSVYEDRAGSLWLGTDGGGVNRLARAGREPGRLAGAVTAFTTRDGLANDTALSLCEDHEGGLWVGTLAGLSRLSPETGGRRSITTFTTKDGLPNDAVFSIYEDGSQSLWVGTAGGLAKRSKTAGFQTFTTKHGLPSDQILAISEDHEGTLWVGTYGGGLARLSRGEERFTSLTTRDGLASDQVHCVHEDAAGTLWVGSAGGLTRVRGGTLTSFTSRDGLADDLVYSVLEDDQGNLWMSCNRGVFRVAKKDLEAYSRGEIPRLSCLSYGAADGMRSAECNGTTQPAGWRSRDGRLWFPTMKGVVAIDPSHLVRNPLPPPVVVEEVLVDKQPLGDGGRTLAPGKEKFEFHYTALSLLSPAAVRFRYRLDGLDRDWVDAKTQRTAYYTNLRPKTYTFRVIACNEDGVWNETGASVTFTLAPYFFQTWWFYLLCAAGVVAVALQAHRVRVSHLRAREAELVRLVDEKTQEVRKANDGLRSVNEKLLEAQEKISRLLASTPSASESVSEWSKAMAEEIAAVIGAKAIGIWEVDWGSQAVTPLSDSGLAAPPLDQLKEFVAPSTFTGSLRDAFLPDVGPRFAESRDGTLVPVTGMSGELRGALVVTGSSVAWGDTERRLVAGFAHQLGAALDLTRMRRQLAAAEERRSATRREMHDRGIATLQICLVCGRCYDHTRATCPEDGAALDSPRPVPYLLLDRYRFLRVIGKGGMGVVLAAHDERLGRDVAVKLVRPEHFNNSELKHRFEREAHAVALIQHPGVVELHDSGELDDGTAFLVMEMLSGCDLRLLIETHGRGKPRQVARLVRQGCAALRAAHRAGVVHRDVKPENVFLVDDPSGFRVKVLDFGLAKSLTFEKGLTQTGMLLGTPVYMAPEQVQGEAVDSRADVYSFAAVVYEALTGRKAISGNDLGHVLINALNFVPPPVSSLVPGIPPEVDAAFESALAKDPARRLKDIELWGSSFVDLLDSVPEDAGIRGWPDARHSLTDLKDSQMERASTQRLPAPEFGVGGSAAAPHAPGEVVAEGAAPSALTGSLRDTTVDPGPKD